jgi:adenylate kinase
MRRRERDQKTLLLLLGAPGAGKGTQGRRLAAAIGALHLSVGDLFRAEITAGSPLGAIAKGAIDKGELVPDELTIAMIAERLARPDVPRRVILDGFPRTGAQASALDTVADEKGWQLAPLLLAVSPAVLTRRLTGRSSCPTCGAIYHVELSPSQQAGICDSDGATLAVRADDQPRVVAIRLANQLGALDAVSDYYRGHRLLARVDGEGPIDEVAARMVRSGSRLFGLIRD